MKRMLSLAAGLAMTAQASVLGVACVDATNAFDPDTAASAQAKAALRGDLRILRGTFDPALMDEELSALTVVLLHNGEAVSRGQCVPENGTIDTELSCDPVAGKAAFAFTGLTPGAYTVRVDATQPDLLPAAMPTVGLAAGEERVLETLRFVPVSDDGGEGQIAGTVALEGRSGGPRSVTLYRRTGSGLEVGGQVPTDASGRFQFERLPSGTYAVSAELSGFTPDYKTSLELRTEDESAAQLDLSDDDGMVLFPATAVLVPSIQQSFGRYYTQGGDVPLQVLAFGGITAMRLSTDPAFTTDDGEDAFSTYSATATVPLPEEEGPIAVYGQFQAVSGDDFTFTTGLFETEVVRDVSAPEVVSVKVRGRSPADDGTVYVQEGGATLALDIAANDAVTAVAGIAVVHQEDNGAGDPASLTFTQLDAPGGLVELSETVGLTEGDGEKRVFVYVKDRAGNVSAAGEVVVVTDGAPPALGDEILGIAPLEVLNATAGVLSSRTAQLSLHVPDGEVPPLVMRVGQGPLPSTGAFLACAPTTPPATSRTTPRPGACGP